MTVGNFCDATSYNSAAFQNIAQRMRYIYPPIADANVQVTMLARGVPVGGELDWLDDGTIAQAMRARRPA